MIYHLPRTLLFRVNLFLEKLVHHFEPHFFLSTETKENAKYTFVLIERTSVSVVAASSRPCCKFQTITLLRFSTTASICRPDDGMGETSHASCRILDKQP